MSDLNVLRDVLTLEAASITKAAESLNDSHAESLNRIFDYLQAVGGQLIFCGVGKSGIIGQKLASTFSSLGLASFFLHPVEALHGDLGRVKKNDCICLISKSGTTEEIIKLLPFLDIDKKNVIGLIGNVNSPLAKECGLLLDCSVEKEACINNQAPTTSSTLALAMGDAMAVFYEKKIDLSKEGFAINHPGGILGKSLRYKVKDLMTTIDHSPTVSADATLQDVIIEMTKHNVGGCAVIGEDKKLIGIIVEGDFRRSFSKGGDINQPVSEIYNSSPVSITGDESAYKALELMEKRKSQIDILPVVDDGIFLGFIRIHDLWKEGFSL